MKWWRCVVAASVLSGVVLTAQPARADDEPWAEPEVESDTWSTVGWGALTVLSNLVYVPAKLVYASLGGFTGGMALGLTGGDLDTAQAIWEPSFGGDYFLTPGMIQGEESFSFAGGTSAELLEESPEEAPEPPAPRRERRDQSIDG